MSKSLCNQFKVGEIYKIHHIFPEGHKKHRTEILELDEINDKVKIYSGMFLDVPTWVETDRFIEWYKPEYRGVTCRFLFWNFLKNNKKTLDIQCQDVKSSN